MQFWIFWLLFCFVFVFVCFCFFFFLIIQSQAAFVNCLYVARFTIVHSKTQIKFPLLLLFILLLLFLHVPMINSFRWVSRKSFINDRDECFLNKFFFIFTVLGAIVYWLFGYAFAFGADGNGFIGHEYFALSYLPSGTFSHWFFHFVFAATAATIVSGAMAERTEFKAYLVYSVFLTGQL